MCKWCSRSTAEVLSVCCWSGVLNLCCSWKSACLAGHDEINIHGVKEHESYRGDRTQASLTTFADNLVPSAGQPHHYIRCSDGPCCHLFHSRLKCGQEQRAHAALATSAYALLPLAGQHHCYSRRSTISASSMAPGGIMSGAVFRNCCTIAK